ncbi:DUF4386 domain-containing protein [Emticicia agri]|uniref:DUF4386 domain-containing protein n=1 Tax=Emticicia agri TaxID=2492393 RepID=A0A4Q5M5S9_9BACT|nr:DUF4386 domain-containing protein [Emticicia agri]RYU97635.1 DUF4386 domain-containing protein [Emticicia agri]
MNTHSDISIRKAAVIAGVSSVVMFFAAMLAEFYGRQRLIVSAHANLTASNIIQYPLSFRMGMLGFIIVLICDVLVSWALYIFLSPVNKSLSLLAALFRLVYTAIFGVSLLNLMTGFRLLTDIHYTSAVNKQTLTLFNAFDDGWAIGLLFFSIHLWLLAYLIFNARFAPKVIGIFLFLASIAYLTDNLAKLLLADYSSYKTLLTILVAIPSIIGEVGFAIWLLIKGRKLADMEPTF